MERVDVVVVGAGFGGLSAALELAEQGRRVVVCEALNIPGGCAATFERGGARYEAGATMFAGFAEGQWMHHLVRKHALEVQVDLLDPVAHFRTPDVHLEVSADREAFVQQLAGLPGAPPGIRPFFAEVRDTADTLWQLFDTPSLLPPLSMGALWAHAVRSPRYVGLLRGIGRPLAARMRAHGVHTFTPLRSWLDAACQITVQAGVERAEAPIAMAAIDYFFRGTAQIRGGIGSLADAFIGAIERRGGEVRLANRVKALERVHGGWRVETRRGALLAEHVVANALPQDVDRLLGREPAGWRVEAVRSSWGAAMLYLRVALDDPGPLHVQAVLDPGRPMVEGNLVLVSVNPAGEGPRTATVSTHVHLEEPMPTRMAAVQQTLRANVEHHLPELQILDQMTASPRTFQRFTRREAGRVGGVPRHAGLAPYLDLWPVQHQRGLWLVGDSVFPGQSVLAVTLSGHRVAEAIRRA